MNSKIKIKIFIKEKNKIKIPIFYFSSVLMLLPILIIKKRSRSERRNKSAKILSGIIPTFIRQGHPHTHHSFYQALSPIFIRQGYCNYPPVSEASREVANI